MFFFSTFTCNITRLIQLPYASKFKNGEIDFDEITYYSNLPTKRTFEIDNEMNYIELKNIGFLFLQSIYNSLGITDFLNIIKSDSKIEYDLNGLTKLLVFERILDPQSKKKTFENRNKYLFDVVNSDDINQIYRTLEVLSENSKKIQNRMNTKIKNSSIGRNTSLTYYDVTNYFFETMYGDDDVYELDKNNEIIKGENGNPVIVKTRINEITITYKNQDSTKSTKVVKEKEIIYWSKKHYEKELNQNKKFIEYLESCKENPDKLKNKQRKSQEFIKTVDIDKETGEIIHPEKVIVFLDKKLEKYFCLSKGNWNKLNYNVSFKNFKKLSF